MPPPNFGASGRRYLNPRDLAFLKRMVVVPMRSLFVPDPQEHDAPFTYPINDNLDKELDKWLPALADVLLERFPGAVRRFDALPASMTEWKQDVSTNANPLAEWLRERVRVTQNKQDYLLLGELKKAYYAEHRPDAVSGDMFFRLAAAFLVSMGAQHTKAGDKIPTGDGGRKSASHIVRYALYTALAAAPPASERV